MINCAVCKKAVLMFIDIILLILIVPLLVSYLPFHIIASVFKFIEYIQKEIDASWEVE